MLAEYSKQIIAGTNKYCQLWVIRDLYEGGSSMKIYRVNRGHATLQQVICSSLPALLFSNGQFHIRALHLSLNCGFVNRKTNICGLLVDIRYIPRLFIVFAWSSRQTSDVAEYMTNNRASGRYVRRFTRTPREFGRANVAHSIPWQTTCSLECTDEPYQTTCMKGLYSNDTLFDILPYFFRICCGGE